ncbi:MAG: methylated-DNA--[protein]-cysteine S-methyltransferase [Cardiobacteriaceae bacterium]|nr:methylated-DNA--[protein]-cysteine S-methyltransferase [Cardiobacteriaceae bacterium]
MIDTLTASTKALCQFSQHFPNSHNAKLYDTPLGIMLGLISADGLHHLTFIDDPTLPTILKQWQANTAMNSPDALLLQQHQHLAMWLHTYFSGQTTSPPPMNLAPQGTPFQQHVWQALCHIPYGTTWTYQQQAQWIGREKAFRAVGSANGCNPIVVAIPCHRVVAKGNGLGGYTGGLWRKSALLHLERTREPLPTLPEYQTLDQAIQKLMPADVLSCFRLKAL